MRIFIGSDIHWFVYSMVRIFIGSEITWCVYYYFFGILLAIYAYTMPINNNEFCQFNKNSYLQGVSGDNFADYCATCHSRIFANHDFLDMKPQGIDFYGILTLGVLLF